MSDPAWTVNVYYAAATGIDPTVTVEDGMVSANFCVIDPGPFGILMSRQQAVALSAQLTAVLQKH